MSDQAERTPVIVGVGQVNDRPFDPQQGLDSAGLMEAALRAADVDGGGGWLARLGSLALVDQISFRDLGDFSADLAARLGAKPRFCYKTRIARGDSPILLLNEAANRIGAGEITTAAIVGGEALRTAAQRAAAAQGTDASAQNASRAMSARRAPDFRARYGLIAPVDVYPLYENAGRAAYGHTLKQGQSESGEIWSRFSEVANTNAGAWIHRPLSADTITTPTADNRPIAFPYTKLMVANSSVNQGAGFIVSSLAEARRCGLSDDQLIYVGLGAAAHECDDPLGRDRYDHSSSMAVSIRGPLELNRVSAEELDFVHYLGDRRLDALVGVGDHKLNAPQAPPGEPARGKSVQNVSASDGPTCMPRTSPRPSALAPTATMTATETMRPFWRTLM